MVDPKLIAPAWAPQIKVSKNEQSRMIARIEEDHDSAIDDHRERMRRFTKSYQLWRGRTTDEQHPNQYRVPILQWQTFAKVAKEIGALFGDDAEVMAQPVGPSDRQKTRKVETFLTWLVMASMQIVNKAIVWDFRKVLFGRAIAWAPWVRETFDVPLRDGSVAEEVAYEGPGFFPQWPDDIVVPSEDVDSIQDFSFVIRKYQATPDELLRGDGTTYQGIDANFERIVQAAKERRDREDEPVKRERDEAEGVVWEGSRSEGNQLEVWEWYGRWRMLKSAADGRRDNFDRRARRESELILRYLPDLQLLIGVQDLARMYPRMPKRRPFLESVLVRDGSYWSMGFGELLEVAERHLTDNNQQASKAAALAVGPLILYRPNSGFDPDTFEYEPGMAIAVDDPAGVRIVTLQADLQGSVMKEQQILGHMERVTGVSDMNMGRSIDRPNAPKTARQTIALLQEGDLRAQLELTGLREDWKAALRHFWALYTMYGPKQTFFRVTERQSNGLFDTAKGGAWMTQDELGGRYDFVLKFATSAYSRESKKQDELTLYGLDLQNPLIVQSPRALWHVLDRVHRAFGDEDLAKLIPPPPDNGMPLDPEEELNQALEGQELAVNPLDQDELHLMKHRRQIEDLQAAEQRDDDAIARLTAHAQAHFEQLQQKRLMAHMASTLARSIGDMTATGRGLANLPGPVGLQQLQGALGEYLGGGLEASA
jgi:hypothetical protein